MKSKLFSFASVVLVALAACSGGGGGGGGGGNANAPPTTPPPATDQAIGGIFRGTLTGCDAVCPADYVVVISEDGEYLAVDPKFELLANIGLVDVTGSRFEGTRNVYLPGPSVKPFGFPPISPSTAATGNNTRSIRGTIVERNSFEGNYFHVSPLSDTQVLADYELAYEDGSSLATISGMYSADDGAGYVLTYVIDGSGVVTGSDSTGCTISGSFELINTAFNLYRTNLSFSACGPMGADGAGYTGLAILRTDGAGTQEYLYFYAATDLDVVVLDLPRI